MLGNDDPSQKWMLIRLFDSTCDGAMGLDIAFVVSVGFDGRAIRSQCPNSQPTRLYPNKRLGYILPSLRPVLLSGTRWLCRVLLSAVAAECLTFSSLVAALRFHRVMAIAAAKTPGRRDSGSGFVVN